MIQGLFALSIAALGWHYLFFSKAAERLAGVEQERLNRLRQRLRRAGGAMMCALGLLFFLGFHAVDQEKPGATFLAVWGGVCILILALLCLALIDVGLTFKLRRHPPQ